MNIALVGTGSMGAAHYRAYRRLPNVHVVGLVGSDRGQRAREWGLPVYPTLRELCRCHPVDAADICTPTFTHRDLALEAAALGLHVFVEKPAALCAEHARQMYDAAERAGVQLYVAQVVQFAPESELLLQAVKDGRYGRPLDACFERLSARPRWACGDWLTDPQKSGGLLLDLHIHDADLMVSAFGMPDACTHTSCGGSAPLRDQYRLAYRYANGLNANAEAAWFNAPIPFTARWRVYFERGMLVCDRNGLTAYADDAAALLCPALRDGDELFVRQLGHFVQCARAGAPSPRVPRERVLGVLQLLERLTDQN